MILETVIVGDFAVNCYIVASGQGKKALIIDPGDDEKKIRKVLDKHKLSAGVVINTHGHFDHIGCNNCFDADIYVHTLDLPMLKDPKQNMSSFFGKNFNFNVRIKTVNDNDSITIDGVTLKVLHTPGHTPGGISLLLEEPKEKVVFAGDTLFNQGIGRTDLSGGDQNAIIKAIKEKLFILPDETVVYPGHGPATTIGEEKRSNPYL